MSSRTSSDALAFLSEALASGVSDADRRDFARDALLEVLPAFTGAYPFGDAGYTVGRWSDAGVLDVEYFNLVGENDGDWSLTVEQALAAIWAICSRADVADALHLATDGHAKVPTHAQVVAAIARFVTGKAAA